MKAKYGLFLVLMLAAMITVSALPCWAQGTSEEKKDEKKEDIWTEEEPRGPRRRPRFELTDEEIDRIMKQMAVEAPKVKVGFRKGQSVQVTDGPFMDFVGVVDDISPEKGKVKVLLSLFGRETPVELDFLQVEKL